MEKKHYASKAEKYLKRGLDIIISLVGLVLLSPLLILIGLAIRIDSRGPVIYRHRRIGKDGKPFDLLKYRSMSVDQDDGRYIEYLKTLIESERDGQALPYRKLVDDPRITRVGRFIRTYYLDEIPQLWNILLGQMTLVGPRPHVQLEVDAYSPEQSRRLTAVPGATGLWQVVGKADCSFSELITLDLQYIDHWSFMLDLKILFLTFLLMLKGGEKFWVRMAETLPGIEKTGVPVPKSQKIPASPLQAWKDPEDVLPGSSTKLGI
jgi:lipopolysaccharide/colanic/teichoic acid biosynthesis glycosyltransferase